MRIKKLQTSSLNLSDWDLPSEEVWCVLGNNASGKSQLAAALCGEAQQGTVEIEGAPKNPAWIGFETLQAQYEAEIAEDETDFLDRQDHGSTGLELLLNSGTSEDEIKRQAKRFGISSLLNRGCRLFSSGEIRRVQILAEWLKKPDLLILDEPFDALDVESYATCSALFESLASEGQAILLLVNRVDDIAPWASHVAFLQDGQLIHKGSRTEIFDSDLMAQLLRIKQGEPKKVPEPLNKNALRFDPIVNIKSGSVNYGPISQFKDLDWTLRPGQHTLITGPNGCGKSTLLALLTGDHPQCYTNEIDIVGYRRGTGESIWDIKKHIGYVSPSLHRDYRVSCSVEAVVISGFHDSIGLYESTTAQERNTAHEWLALFELLHLATKPFRSLSYGQQRLVLVARALVKQPPLLILDEPTQGLDDLNRNLVLASIELLSSLSRTTLLLVSHRKDEHLPLFKKRLVFEENDHTSTRFTIRKLG